MGGQVSAALCKDDGGDTGARRPGGGVDSLVDSPLPPDGGSGAHLCTHGPGAIQGVKDGRAPLPPRHTHGPFQDQPRVSQEAVAGGGGDQVAEPHESPGHIPLRELAGNEGSPHILKRRVEAHDVLLLRSEGLGQV